LLQENSSKLHQELQDKLELVDKLKANSANVLQEANNQNSLLIAKKEAEIKHLKTSLSSQNS
jgi:hypothetical protein